MDRGGHVGSARVFGYQHVGIDNMKVSHWGYCQTQTHNVSGFVLQWNIGFNFQIHVSIFRCLFATKVQVLFNLNSNCKSFAFELIKVSNKGPGNCPAQNPG